MKNTNWFQITLASASILTLALAPSAEAIVYFVNNANTSSGGTLTGSFDFTPTNTYTNWSITISGSTVNGALNGTYNPSNSFVVTSPLETEPTSTQLFLALNGSDLNSSNFEFLRFQFTNSLTGLFGDSTTLVQGNFPAFGSPSGSYITAQGNIGPGDVNAREVITGGVITTVGVPLETDALPALVGLTFAGAGIWLKRKKKKNGVGMLNN